MEFNNQSDLAKSRMTNQSNNYSNGHERFDQKNGEKQKTKTANFPLVFFFFFIVIVIISVFIRVMSQKPTLDATMDLGEEISFNETVEEVITVEPEVVITDQELPYETPERIYHIEKRQQFCAADITQARKLYSEYVGSKNKQVLALKPATVNEEQWISEKKTQGAYRENLGERERDYYFEYPTTAGPYVDLIRIHKCEVFNPGGRIIPIISISEDGYIPEYELGFMGIENMTEEDMVSYIQYLISLRDDNKNIQTTKKKLSGDILTITLEINYDVASNWMKLKDSEEVYNEAIYKLDLTNGLLKYSAQLLVREKQAQ